ncbi:AAA+ family ATPase [Methylophaga frappieri]|uniref:AAA+ family ATPase n=1 Tax=Methylophaga frappieri (strain ATCC BAA-2434 / DSM 25690 / JAM7) TaxID=754477 RepID=I1YEM9_METFJ|nr:ATP-binding protein [Methylophaga frappieri]AFJ01372.1 AAA+ family ATPase [Methylophaga frappieri]
MSFIVSHDFIKATEHSDLAPYRDKVAREEADSRGIVKSTEIEVEPRQLSLIALQDMARVADKLADRQSKRAIEAILLARDGEFDNPIPNFKAFSSTLQSYLKHNLIDGWVYIQKADQKYYPALVTDFSYKPAAAHAEESLLIHVCHLSPSMTKGYYGFEHDYIVFYPSEVNKKRIAEALEVKHVYKETDALKADYEASMARYYQAIQGQFSEQFIAEGFLFTDRAQANSDGAAVKARVIHDMAANEVKTYSQLRESCLVDDEENLLPLPEWCLLRVFNLKTHAFFWIHSDYLTAYEYDQSLKDKLILPKTHHDLLDVLTTNVDIFSGDIIEGKTAGNVILCKGIPGVGKTLTAEIYSELIERPLYLLHSGSLGTNAKDIEENLRTIFARSERWNCVLLLDEADVFIVKRHDNIEQNAIVAEFLRTMEYFSGLLFMTTNRPSDIDEAIISRCAAIIEYTIPTPENAARIWQVFARQYQFDLTDKLLGQLLATFEQISPRDMKMLLRLVLRVANNLQVAPDIDTFRKCAMFRAIKITETDF